MSQPYFITPSGSGFSVPEEYSPKGTGALSHTAVMSTRAESGFITLFQGQTGHFYLTDGIDLICLSEGRLETLVASLNKSALDKTICFFDSVRQDAVWMVCTGVNTSPDKMVIFNLKTKSWRTKTQGASVVASDWIHDTYPNQEMFMGGNASGQLFHFDTAHSDLGLAIASTVESADIDFTEKQGYEKAYLKALVKLTGATAAQVMNLKWYIDEGSTESHSGGVNITMAVSATEHTTALNGLGRSVRYRLYNSDSLGQWIFQRIGIDFAVVSFR
jgi:hypothetical protein